MTQIDVRHAPEKVDRGPMRRRAVVGLRLAAAVIAAAVLASGCEYIDMVRRHRRLQQAFEEQPRLGLARELAPEQLLHLGGGLVSDPGRDEPLAILALSDRYVPDEVVAWRMVPGSVWSYGLLLPEGDYELLVFADLDRDGRFGDDEVVGRTPPGKVVAVRRAAAADEFVVDGPTLRLDYAHPSSHDLPVPLAVAVTNSVVGSLDDERFDRGYGVMGLYDSARFLEHTQGYFFGLEPFDEDKTQVLFVHGAGGTPRDWTYFVDGLDRARFQPWFYFYPSGLPLDRSAIILAASIARVAASKAFPLERLVVVAHSMGGLVARSALNRLTATGAPPYLKMFVTLSTPYRGHDAALAAVENAPEVIPSWHDMAPGSPFLRSLATTALPEDVPFFLIFGYRDPGRVRLGPNSDGTVTLRSELDFTVQWQATNVYGINASHDGILASASARRLLNDLIEPTAPAPGVLEQPFAAVKRALGASR